jgi:hypothetical protein
LTRNLRPVHFELVKNIPLFDVKVNGENKKFILDSGSHYMVLNGKYEDEGNMPATSNDGMNSLKAKTISSFEWGEISLSNQMALVSDISHLEQSLNTNVHGLIGCAQFMNFDLLLDYREFSITLIDFFGETPDCMKGARAIPFIMSNHIPVVPVGIGNRIFSLGLDTGASHNVIGKEYEQYLDGMGVLSDITRDVLYRFENENTEQEATLCSVNNVIIGDSLTLDGMRFYFHDINIPSVKIDGLLGFELFNKQKALIRFNKRVLLLQDY